MATHSHNTNSLINELYEKLDAKDKIIEQKENIIVKMRSHISKLNNKLFEYERKIEDNDEYERNKQIIKEKMKDVNAFAIEMAMNLHRPICLDYCKWFLECLLDEDKVDRNFDKLKEVFNTCGYHIYDGLFFRSLNESVVSSISYYNEDAYNKYLKTHTEEELLKIKL